MQVTGGAIIAGGARTAPLVTATTGKTPSFEYLLIGGGGGGGLNRGGGGGGGGVLYGTMFPVVPGKTITVTVGSGGIIIGSRLNGCGGKGGDTTISAPYTNFAPSSPGGGGGGCNTTQPTFQNTPGGSGGGGGMFAASGVNTGIGGSPSIPAAAPLFGTQMFYGNRGGHGGGNNTSGGGGGGAGARGTDGALSDGAYPGGIGTNAFATWASATSTGVSGYYAGGGGGGTFSAAAGGGGTGGGGAGSSASGGAGTPNTGGGGGGSGNTGNLAASTVHGGSGLAIIRYPNTYDVPVSTTGLLFNSGGFYYYRFTTVGAGTITF